MGTAFNLWWSRRTYLQNYGAFLNDVERHCHVDDLWIYNRQQLIIPIYYRKKTITPNFSASIVIMMMADYWEYREKLADGLHIMTPDEVLIKPINNWSHIVFTHKQKGFIGSNYEKLFDYPVQKFETSQLDEQKNVYLPLQQLTYTHIKNFTQRGYFELYYDITKNVLNVMLNR